MLFAVDLAGGGKVVLLPRCLLSPYHDGMELSKEDINEFGEIWREEFKEEILPNEARHRASQLLELYALLSGFPPEQSSEPLPGTPQP